MYDLEQQFDQDMLSVYRSAKRECNYVATYFFNMLNELRGVRTAKRLLSDDNVQYGFEKLWECGCLHLTVECLVLRLKYQSLFDETELDRARQRLRNYDYDPTFGERE